MAGALSCLLAERGFDVTGIDIAPTAIERAREIAARRNLQIQFEVADVCRHMLPDNAFDLIVDSHLLHCIVFEPERLRLLKEVRRSLKKDGEFWVETMLLEEGQEADPAWNLDDRGVVWSKIKDGANCAEAVKADGEWWLPQRLIARSRNALLDEFRAAGLRVLEYEVYPPAAAREPGGLRARCGRDSAD